MNERRLLCACALLGLLAGCARTAELAATEVLNDANCKGAADGLARVTYREVAALRGTTLISIAEPEPEPAAHPELILLSLAAGTQPTAGYRFELRDALLDDGVAVLHLDWHTPDPDASHAQVVTFPCLVVGLEPGAFTRIRAVDQHGRVLDELDL